MFLHVEEATIIQPFTFLIKFNNGEWRKVDLSTSLNGPVFEPLRDAREFSQAFVNPETGTVEWPNGADLAPEHLFEIGTAAEASDMQGLRIPA